MKNNSVKAVVAVGIGAALFFILGRFVVIPSPIPNTNISLQYAVLGLLAAMYGPVAGGLIGLIGHTLIDLSWGGSPWWSWVIASAFVGVVVGFFAKKLALNEGRFGKKGLITFSIANILAHLIAWIGIAPGLDILIYAEPVDKAFAQAALASVANIVTSLIVGSLLIVAYTKTITGKGSLDLEFDGSHIEKQCSSPLCSYTAESRKDINMVQPIISFKAFGFQYHAQKHPTLHDIDLDIYPGERVLIVGPSGSGKSTLGNCLNGLIPHSYPGKTTGSLMIDGVDASKASIFDLSAHVGTVLQDPDGQFIGLTVAEDIAFALENACTPQPEMREIVRKTAELVNIDHRLEYAPHELSGGQKQRVSLAGVMVDTVKILLFDEPLANLDPAAGKRTIELIDDIQKRTDTTVIIIEHRLEDVLWRHVDRIVLVDEGTILADTSPNELLSGDLLTKHGIREPLYLTALKYAGVEITPEKCPEHVDKLKLNDSDKAKVRSWFEQATDSHADHAQPVTLELKDVSFGYTREVRNLQNISFSVRKGEMLSIVGRNGAGKSTLAKLICGFENLDSGTMQLDGKDMTDLTIRERAGYIGYVMQNPNQMISKTMIYDEVAIGLRNSGLSETAIRERVEETLKICGLYPFRNWPISALSFGQKKRVTIACVLAMGPQVIILDEPTAGQDFRHYTEIMEFLRSLNAQGVTVIMITHDMHLMLEYTPRALVFDTSELIADCSAAEVLCSSELVARASLKETCLFNLAGICEIDDPIAFTKRFIHADREVREHGR